ncbi:MAG: acyl-CoA dehydrogenase family protein [Ilumatobacteraceae bacterium]
MPSGRDREGFDPCDDGAASRLDWIRHRLHALGRTPSPGSGLTVQRFVALAEIAGIDGALVRLAEGHLDALTIREELGAPPEPDDCDVWAVWAAQPKMLAAEPNGSGWRLCGVKPWCSGAAGIDRALVTATDPAGHVRLFEVDVEELTFDDDWRPMGMRASASHTGHVDVTVAASAQLGPAGGYVERAGFWHGGIGVAACWHGLAQRLSTDLATQARRGDDPYVRAAAGRAAGSVAAASTLLAAAGRQIDDDPHDIRAAERRAQLVRVAVAGLAQAVLDESVTAQGAGALCFDADHARAVADLTVYVRQLHHGRDAAAVEVRADDDWWSS